MNEPLVDRGGVGKTFRWASQVLQSAPRLVHVFAYGSNMHPRRIRARVTSAEPVATGYVTGRRLAFHKRGADGSGKADATYTDCASDRVWGVVYSLSEYDKPVLDAYESLSVGYDSETVLVHTAEDSIDASIYVARSEAIDPALKPYSWYLRFVLMGAKAHNLPAEYLHLLDSVEAELDADRERHLQNIRVV